MRCLLERRRHWRTAQGRSAQSNGARAVLVLVGLRTARRRRRRRGPERRLRRARWSPASSPSSRRHQRLPGSTLCRWSINSPTKGVFVLELHLISPDPVPDVRPQARTARKGLGLGLGRRWCRSLQVAAVDGQPCPLRLGLLGETCAFFVFVSSPRASPSPPHAKRRAVPSLAERCAVPSLAERCAVAVPRQAPRRRCTSPSVVPSPSWKLPACSVSSLPTFCMSSACAELGKLPTVQRCTKYSFV